MTRREAIELAAQVAVAAVAEQAAVAQQPNAITLNWLEAAPAVATGVSWGVPFARGTVSKAQTFALTARGAALPLQRWPLAYWPDGSIKFIGFATAAPANTTADFRLAPGVPSANTPALKVQQTATAINIDTGVLQCGIPKQGSNLIGSLTMDGREVARHGRLVCTLDDGKSFLGETKTVTVEQSGPVRCTIGIDFKAVDGPREWLPFTVRLYFYAGQEKVRLIHSIVFDGDQEKDFIKDLGIEFSVPMREQAHNGSTIHRRWRGNVGGTPAAADGPETR
ncbi:MAG: hypothetical protein M3N54_07605 [Acidobacteriota bacterium]|nr:hypothetical protein [Acidobacteriota bacterium]